MSSPEHRPGGWSGARQALARRVVGELFVVAAVAGWWVTEIGRQPFLVYGLLRTADLVAPHASGTVLSTLVAYLAVYVFLLLAYIGVLMYMAQHPAMPTPETPQSPKAGEPIGGPA